MSGLRPRLCRNAAVFILVFTMLLNALPAITVHGAFTCLKPPCSKVEVSPGKYAQTLGTDFPSFTSVKLSYPNSSILTNSMGDLLFAVTLSPPPTNRTINGFKNASLYNSIDIYIPPDFTGITIGNFWTSFTNDYGGNSLSVSRGGSSDSIGPNWWRVSVRNIIVTNDVNVIKSRESTSNLTVNRVFAANKTQYIRLFQVISPTIAGRYFFKAFLNGTSIRPENFPTVVVAGTNDPAYISGTLLDSGNTDPSQAGRPVYIPNGEGGRILATGIDYLGRAASAQAFINANSTGEYTLFGVAPGTYNLTAYVAGYIPTTRLVRVSVLPAQSLDNINIYLQRSAIITGVALSRTADGVAIPWGQLSAFRSARDTSLVAANRSITVRVVSLDGSVVASIPAAYSRQLFTNYDATTFSFSIQREFVFDGRIPQDYANYTSGLTPGDYYLYAYVTSYIQLDNVLIHVSNETLRTYSEIPLIRTGFFSITVHFKDYASSLADSNVALGGTLTVSVYDQSWTLRGSNTTFVAPNSTSATVEVMGSSSARGLGDIGLLSANYGLPPGTYHIVARFTSSPLYTGATNVGVRDTYFQLEDYQGIVTLATRSDFSSDGLHQVFASEISFPMIRGGGISLTIYSVDTEQPPVYGNWIYSGAAITLKIIDHVGNVYTTNATQRGNQTFEQFYYAGLLTDDYEIVVITPGYRQYEIPRIHVSLGADSDISIRMILEPTIDLTLVFKTEDILSAINSTQPYAQPLNSLDATPVRLEVYDEYGNFVAANRTYIPNLTELDETSTTTSTTSARFILFGFNQYYGDPASKWAGFYDTTDAARQDDGGLQAGVYTIEVWVDGYYQSEALQVNLGGRGSTSAALSLQRASRISGIVLGPTIYNQARFLSWAVVDLEPGNGNYTTFTTDGYYQVWMPAGTYNIGVALAGYSTRTAQVAVPQGSDLRMDFWLDYFQASPAYSAIQLQVAESWFANPKSPFAVTLRAVVSRT
jgi:hypothetical protein